jgi:flagellar basal-body rod protein FlgB
MSGPLESITSDLITKALDVSLARHEVIANNIANSESAGYRPLKVDFDSIYEQMKGVLESGADYDLAKAALRAIEVAAEQDPAATGVLLDQQIVDMARNTTHYQALLSARGQFGEIMKLAVRGGQS